MECFDRDAREVAATPAAHTPTPRRATLKVAERNCKNNGSGTEVGGPACTVRVTRSGLWSSPLARPWSCCCSLPGQAVAGHPRGRGHRCHAVAARTTECNGLCPRCAGASRRVHAWHARRLIDLPVAW